MGDNFATWQNVLINWGTIKEIQVQIPPVDTTQKTLRTVHNMQSGLLTLYLQDNHILPLHHRAYINPLEHTAMCETAGLAKSVGTQPAARRLRHRSNSTHVRRKCK